MNKLTAWIKRHQVTAFFILTFAITLGLGFSYDAVIRKGNLLLAPLAFIATCGPALAGIVITTITRSPGRGQNTHTGLPSLWHGVYLRSCFLPTTYCDAWLAV